MKHLAILLTSYFLALTSFSAVPLRWTVETSAANPATFDQFAGATYDLEAALQTRGKPLAVSGEAKLYWQTNGMGSAWWTAPATVSGNVLRATWTPACDVGAKVYSCFIGITGTVYNAAFQLRLRPSPGATPNALPLPTPVIDFSRVTVLNPPWSGGGGSGGTDTNDVRAIVNEAVGGTNAVKAAVAAVAGKIDKPTVDNPTVTIDTTSGAVLNVGTGYNDAGGVVNVGNSIGGMINVGTADSPADTTMVLIRGKKASTEDDLDAKRDIADNVCAVDSFGEWVASGVPEGVTLIGQPRLERKYESDVGPGLRYWWYADANFGTVMYSINVADGSETNIEFTCYDYGTVPNFSATRSKVAVSNDTFVTHAFVTNFVSGHASPPSPTLRVYDEVLSCWWIGKMVNGVMSWEVE